MKWPWQKTVSPRAPEPVRFQIPTPAPVVFSEERPAKPAPTYCEINRGVRGKATVWETHSVCGPRVKRSKAEVDHVVTTGHWLERP